MISAALPEVRKLVAKYDLASVNAAIKSLYENRKAERELREAEEKVAALKKKLS
jgi:N-methylhydantoinase B/oxoprolinase/acetone carboxylase alpha subunit